MSYLIDHYKGLYRLRTPYDLSTNAFPVDLKGNYSDNDIYIDGIAAKVFYYGNRGTLEAYIDSLGRGRNMIKNIYTEYVGDISKYVSLQESTSKDGEIKTTSIYDYDAIYKDNDLNKLIFNIIESDEEVLFRFKADSMDKLAKYFKFKTSAADRSPFSSKNLPKSDFRIPDDKLLVYKQIISKLPQEKILKVGYMTNEFIKNLATKKNPMEAIKADMKKNMLKGKEYIFFINKWDDYLKYLSKEVDELCNI